MYEFGAAPPQATTSFDELGAGVPGGHVCRRPSGGAVGSSLHADTWFDARGQVVKQAAAGGLVTKYLYDGAGRVAAAYLTDGGGDAGYADADDVAGDTVLEQSEPGYDADGNTTQTTTRQRFHDASGTGASGSPSSGVAARVSYTGSYLDPAGRPTASVDVGTNGGGCVDPAGVRPDPVGHGAGGVADVRRGRAGVRVHRPGRAGHPGHPGRARADGPGRSRTSPTGRSRTADDKTTDYTYNAAGMTSLTAR